MAKGLWYGKANPTDVLEVNKYYDIEMGIIPIRVHDAIARQGIPQDRMEPRVGIAVKGSELIVVYTKLDEIVADWELYPDDHDFGDIEQGEIKVPEEVPNKVIEFAKPDKSNNGGIILE